MPSRALPSPSPANQPSSTTNISPPLTLAGLGFSLLFTFSLCFCKSNRKRRSSAAVISSSTPPQKPPLREFTYSSLRSATASFSPENKLGQGGFGSVFRGTLPHPSPVVAVKVMDSGSLQGEREFQNELFFAGKLDSPRVVSVIGFSRDRKRRRLALVYEMMDNGNLQDALLHRKAPELMEWERRFLVAVDIAKGIEDLHGLNPPVIHGDLKPSNVLLDGGFNAKIADFGLARLKSDQVAVTVGPGSDEVTVTEVRLGSNDVESVVTSASVCDESVNFGFTDQSPVSVCKVVESPETFQVPMTSPETLEVTMTSPETLEVTMTSPETAKSVSVSPEMEVKRNGKEMEDKEGNGGGGGGGEKVKDYVTQWIGSEVRKESEWVAETSEAATKKKSRNRLEWWLSLDEEEKDKKKKKKSRRMVREWWKDEYRKELAKRVNKKKEKKKKKTLESEFHSDDVSSSNSITSSNIDWWLERLSGGEQLRARRKTSHDSAKSCGGVSSTPSMRGTMCYVAPECCGNNNIDDVSEKCDVYSYGVLLLVLVSGRRPLDVTGPASEIIQRANLMSWARKLARRGRLGDLVDEKLQCLDQEQAVLCIKVALQCLQRSPVLRPSMKDVLGMLTGAMSPPELPREFSPSPQSQFPFKTRRKQRR